MVPPSNMTSSSSKKARKAAGLGADGTSSPRKSAEDFGARRGSAEFSTPGAGGVDDLGYHLEKIKLPKEKKKRHLVGLSSTPQPPTAPPLRPSASSQQLLSPSSAAQRAVSPSSLQQQQKPKQRQPSQTIDGGVLDLRTATLRSNAQRSAAGYGYGTKGGYTPSSSFIPSSSSSTVTGLSGTALAHSRPYPSGPGGTLLAPPRMERIASSSSSLSDSSALPSPLANPAPPPDLTRITSADSSTPSTTNNNKGGGQGGGAGEEGGNNRFYVPPPGKLARKTREVQEDYAMGVHGMRRSYESFKLDVRFGMARTKKKMERVRRFFFLIAYYRFWSCWCLDGGADAFYFGCRRCGIDDDDDEHGENAAAGRPTSDQHPSARSCRADGHHLFLQLSDFALPLYHHTLSTSSFRLVFVCFGLCFSLLRYTQMDRDGAQGAGESSRRRGKTQGNALQKALRTSS